MLSRLNILLLFSTLLATTAGATDASDGMAQYDPCIACHQANGSGDTELQVPAIAGQSAAYIVRQLQNFRGGFRGVANGDNLGAQMRPMAMAIKDDEAVAELAAYVAALPIPTPVASVSGIVPRGRKEYIGKCGACHGGDGQGNEALNAPRLTSISDSYLIRQVKNFRSGLRGTHRYDIYGKQMAIMARLVNDEQLNDIAAYINEIARQN